MTLGQRIQTLRAQKDLSQSEVADALGVSRQSVSKWETDASVPELEKLLALSDLFGITLDELARGTSASEAASPAEAPQSTGTPDTAHPERFFGRKLAGTLFFCFGALVLLLCALQGDALSGLILAAPLVLLGVICFCVRKHTVLWCVWAAYGCASLYLSIATGVTWRLTRLRVFTPDMNYTRLAVSWLELFIVLALMLVTAFRFSSRPLAPNPSDRRKIVSALACCAALAVCFAPIPTPTFFTSRSTLLFLWYFFLDALRCALLTALVCFLLRLLRTLRAKNA